MAKISRRCGKSGQSSEAARQRDQELLKKWSTLRPLPTCTFERMISELGDGVVSRFSPFRFDAARIHMPLRVRDTPIDILSWPPDKPDEFRTVRTSSLLGVEAVTEALYCHTALRIFRSPWSMLVFAASDPWIYARSAPPGVVILDPSAGLGGFAYVDGLICEDEAHACELERQVRASGREPPDIWFPRDIDAANK